jgi:hypothetical protein
MVGVVDVAVEVGDGSTRAAGRPSTGTSSSAGHVRLIETHHGGLDVKRVPASRDG